MSDSPRQRAANRTFSQVENINPNVPNLFEGYQDPFSTGNILSSLDEFTGNAVGKVRKGIKSDINTSGSRIGSRLAGQGITGGALLEDTLAGGENRIRKAGQKTIEGLQSTRLGLTPGVLERGNQSAFRNRSADQSTRFAQLRALFDKFRLQLGGTNALDPDSTFDDILASLNTAGGFIPE